MAGHRCRHRRHSGRSCPPLILAPLPEREAQLLEFRKTLPTCRARRLISEFDLPIGHRALERIRHQRGLLGRLCQSRRRCPQAALPAHHQPSDQPYVLRTHPITHIPY